MAAALLVNSVASKFFVLAEYTSPNENGLRAMVAMNFVFSLFYTMIGIISWVYPAEVGASIPFLIYHNGKVGPRLLTTIGRSSQLKYVPGKLPFHRYKLESQPRLCAMRPNCSGRRRVCFLLLLLRLEFDRGCLLHFLIPGDKG